MANQVSSLSSALRRLGVDTSPFCSVDVGDLLTSIKANLRHTPVRRMPVVNDLLGRIVWELRADNEAPTVVFAVLTMYYTFLRQSNLGPRNKTAFDETRHLLRGDIIIQEDAVIYALKWSKTTQGPLSTSVAAPALPGSVLCPVQACHAMLQFVPTVALNQPMLSFRDFTPMPTSYLNKAWDKATTALGLPLRSVTLHSLRRGGCDGCI